MTSTNDLEGFTSDVVVTPPGGLTSDVVVTPPGGGLTTEGSGGITSLEAVTALNGLFGSEGRQDEGAYGNEQILKCVGFSLRCRGGVEYVIFRVYLDPNSHFYHNFCLEG